MNETERTEVLERFRERVNLPPRELEDWLETDESKRVGDADDRESTGHRSGRRIVSILRSKQADLTEADYEHMREVVGYVNRHTAQRPDGDVSETPWRYSLMNWGHDPLRTDEASSKETSS